MMKQPCFTLAAILSALCLLCGCTQTATKPDGGTAGTAGDAAPSRDSDAIALVSDIPTTQYFTDDAVSESDMETILTAGINAPSAMNGQPWHFSVITDSTVLEQISEDMSAGRGTPPGGAPTGASGGAAKAGIADAPAVIVVSCAEGSALDAGLACQNMSVAAQLLGYGTKIISSPTIAVNGEKQAEYRALLGIPDDLTAVAFLLIGTADPAVDENADGYTAATARNPMDDMVTYVTGA